MQINSAMNFEIFPNPAYDKLTVINNSPENEGKIRILDFRSQVLIEQPIKSANENVNIGSLAEGAYIIEVEYNNRIVVKKFIKMIK